MIIVSAIIETVLYSYTWSVYSPCSWNAEYRDRQTTCCINQTSWPCSICLFCAVFYSMYILYTVYCRVNAFSTADRAITMMMIVYSVLPFILFKLTRGPFRTESRDHHRRTACRSDPDVLYILTTVFVLVTVSANFNVQYQVINSGPSRKAS